MSNDRLWLSTIIEEQKQACYMNLQMDPLYNPLGTRPIQTGREMSMEPYPNQQFGFIDDPDGQSGSGSVPTRNRTWSDGPDPLLTLLRGIGASSTHTKQATNKQATNKPLAAHLVATPTLSSPLPHLSNFELN